MWAMMSGCLPGQDSAYWQAARGFAGGEADERPAIALFDEPLLICRAKNLT